MPKVGERHIDLADHVWNGTKWVPKSEFSGGASKSTEQIKSDLGFKAGPKPAAAPTTGLAAYAAKNRVKTMQEQADAVEKEAEEKKKKRASPPPK